MLILYKDLVQKLQILPLLVPGCVALGKQPHLSESHLRKWGEPESLLMGLP